MPCLARIWPRRAIDGHDLRRCPLEDRKALQRDVIGAARCLRVVAVDYVAGIGRKLFEAVRHPAQAAADRL